MAAVHRDIFRNETQQQADSTSSMGEESNDTQQQGNSTSSDDTADECVDTSEDSSNSSSDPSAVADSKDRDHDDDDISSELGPWKYLIGDTMEKMNNVNDINDINPHLKEFIRELRSNARSTENFVKSLLRNPVYKALKKEEHRLRKAGYKEKEAIIMAWKNRKYLVHRVLQKVIDQENCIEQQDCDEHC